MGKICSMDTILSRGSHSSRMFSDHSYSKKTRPQVREEHDSDTDSGDSDCLILEEFIKKKPKKSMQSTCRMGSSSNLELQFVEIIPYPHIGFCTRGCRANATSCARDGLCCLHKDNCPCVIPPTEPLLCTNRKEVPGAALLPPLRDSHRNMLLPRETQSSRSLMDARTLFQQQTLAVRNSQVVNVHKSANSNYNTSVQVEVEKVTRKGSKLVSSASFGKRWKRTLVTNNVMKKRVCVESRDTAISFNLGKVKSKRKILSFNLPCRRRRRVTAAYQHRKSSRIKLQSKFVHSTFSKFHCHQKEQRTKCHFLSCFTSRKCQSTCIGCSY